jgi:hypothetical protein
LRLSKRISKRRINWARTIRKFFAEKDAQNRTKLKGTKVFVPLEKLNFLACEDRSGTISEADLKLMWMALRRIRKPLKELLGMV